MTPRTGKPEGRPSDYSPELCAKAHKLCQSGATDYEIAKALDINVATFYRWRHAHDEFREALKLGKESADDRVELTLYRRALGYENETIKIMQYEGQVIVHPYVENIPPDVGALKMWLINRRPDQWREKVDVSNTVSFIDKLEQHDFERLSESIAAVAADRGDATKPKP